MTISLMFRLQLAKLLIWFFRKYLKFKCWITRKHHWYHFYEVDENGKMLSYIRQCMRCGLEEKFKAENLPD